MYILLFILGLNLYVFLCVALYYFIKVAKVYIEKNS